MAPLSSEASRDEGQPNIQHLQNRREELVAADQALEAYQVHLSKSRILSVLVNDYPDLINRVKILESVIL